MNPTDPSLRLATAPHSPDCPSPSRCTCGVGEALDRVHFLFEFHAAMQSAAVWSRQLSQRIGEAILRREGFARAPLQDVTPHHPAYVRAIDGDEENGMLLHWRADGEPETMQLLLEAVSQATGRDADVVLVELYRYITAAAEAARLSPYGAH